MTMVQQKKTVADDKLSDAICNFLASPPEGTPEEVIEAFGAPGVEGYLPPRLFLETVEQAPIAISITDPSARILYVNSAFEQLTGYPREEVIGENESVLSSHSTPDSIYRELWQTIQDRRVWRGKLINHRHNREEYLADITISPVLNAQGEIAYYLGMHRDVTALHQLEQRLRFQQSLTEEALNSAPMVVAMVTHDHKVLFDNRAYKALMGDFRGMEPAELFLAALEQQIEFDLSSVCQIGKGFTNVEVRLDPPGGASPRWFSCSGARVAELNEEARNYFKQAEQSRCCLLLIANEVTASRKRVNEARLNMIRAGMAEQQMVQTMREAISGAIFKLQAPLNVIKAALAIPNPLPEESGLQSCLQQALSSGEEAIASLQAALPDPAKEQSSQVNINEILHEVIRLSTEKLLANGVVLDWQPTPVLPAITGRNNALRGLFKYLIDNAIEAVCESGHDYREIRLETRVDNQELTVEIIDNGPGIPKAQRLKAFEPFFCGWNQPRTHAGMGLTMVQEIVMGHGGSVEIDPEFYGGCHVLVHLPLNGANGE